MEQVITTTKGGSFGNKGSLAIALKNAGLQDSYEAAEFKGGGWVGVPRENFANGGEKDNVLAQKPPNEEAFSPPVSSKTVKVRVHRANMDPENSNLQISLCVNSSMNRKIFYPGEEVELTPSEIESLKDSVEETQIIVPPGSGIYQTQDPMALAKNQYPGMAPTRDSRTNLIVMVKRIPNYIIEVVE